MNNNSMSEIEFKMSKEHRKIKYEYDYSHLPKYTYYYVKNSRYYSYFFRQ